MKRDLTFFVLIIDDVTYLFSFSYVVVILLLLLLVFINQLLNLI